jgi:hypothetical protein
MACVVAFFMIATPRAASVAAGVISFGSSLRTLLFSIFSTNYNAPNRRLLFFLTFLF